ncbi:multicopper oxidase-1 [Coleophoma crateriformis]|uniref:laccase n=1 Tax=Coleophoma crateriformis TaxID=565419 RepID=A0A3D8SHW7_9HELO|nr:multicopper oxidase-1 [Coleophoma crateriformis]
MQIRRLLALLAAAPLALAAPKFEAPSLFKRCTNSAEDRSCWGDYDLSTNYYDEAPDTGVVREYWFDITNTTAAPDGIERMILAINGTVPGPTIIADWGDTVVVHVTNSMQNNGTGIHWHGVRQNGTTQNDGVPSMTQCPIAPGSTYTYTWKAVQYGSSWYHSHFYVQAWDGVFGGIVINGPATADYDEDLGSLFLNDWSHATADQELLHAEAYGPPTLDNGLINGTNTYNNSGTIVGSRFSTDFVAGTRYRIRLVNAAADTHFKFTIDNHTMEVIATDFVPIVPYSTDIVSISMGQRYDIIVTANATADNYWLRAIAQTTCSDNDNPQNIMGIVRYDSTSTDDPTSVAWDSASTDDCDDEDMSNLVPYLAIVASDTPTSDEDFSVKIETSGLWVMGNNSFENQWDYPTVLQAYEGNDTWGAVQEVYELPDANTWVYWAIQTTNTQPHPMHLHGHDFWVIGQGSGTYDAATTNLTLVNAPRRDTVMLPGAGYVVIAFYTDNPGAWLMHCHIAWHTSEGLAIQILERESEFVPTLDASVLNSTCAAWDTYAASSALVQDDSGI